MAELVLEEKNGTRHRVTWMDAPDVFYADDLPLFRSEVQTYAEQQLGAGGVPRKLGQKAAPRRSFTRVRELDAASELWLYQEA